MPPIVEVNGRAARLSTLTLLTPDFTRLQIDGGGSHGATITVRIASGNVQHATLTNTGPSGAWTDVSAGGTIVVGPDERREVRLVALGQEDEARALYPHSDVLPPGLTPGMLNRPYFDPPPPTQAILSLFYSPAP